MTPDDFNISEIEAVQVEFVECPECYGSGDINNGVVYFRCKRCFGTGMIEKESEGEHG